VSRTGVWPFFRRLAADDGSNACASQGTARESTAATR